jgi:hypothetical protein
MPLSGAKLVPHRLNPVFKGNLERITKDDLDGWRNLIHKHTIELRPTGTKPIRWKAFRGWHILSQMAIL